MTRQDFQVLLALEVDLSAVGLEQSENIPYFCTPEGAEYVGWIGCDGVHFVLLPEDERIYCVDPAMGGEGTYVLPVAKNLREFLSFLLFCRDASPISQIYWLEEERFRNLLREDDEASWEGCETFFARRAETLSAIAEAFRLEPKDPYGPVRAMQAAFDPSRIVFSDEYYDVLGLENPRRKSESMKE